ncbi:PocR ligand-binding domain-containing protein [Desulfopila aestuarii]|uniref:histidine kinase n=1 Tax=Desulfopila aestuarii DSM 18488 TaxID=1121416 RepID=A0A1M7YJY5_9BACT|nr:PocR ligand-binding domain-containing protein [Desulfopila aestuarii]SHO52922.1 PAS domain S-box-containing protein [Desulfopila aestuarii DSM 18488]
MNEQTPPDATQEENAWNYTLPDLVSLELLQRIQDSFAIANQVASTITDVNGNPITRFSNHSGVCKIVRNSEKGLANCIRSAEALGQQAAETQKPFYKKCLSCGFADAAAPIIVDGHHIANWLIGQYYIGDVDDKRIIEYAAEIDVDPDSMLLAFQEMPRLSRERFEKILDFLWLMANEISRMGYLNLKLKQQAEELEITRQQLMQQKSDLELAVADRTQELQDVNLTLRQELVQKDRIQQQQNRLLTAIEKLGEAIAITDVDGNIIYINPAFTDITGYSTEEVIGQNPRILKSGRHSNSFYREFWQTVISKGTWSGRFINKRKDGTIYTEESTVSAVRDENSKVISYVAIKRDISKELELERQLLQAVKLESIGTMAAGIAHEINTPVQYIGSNLEFLQDAFADLQEFVTYIEQQQPPSGTPEISNKLEEIDWEYLNEEIPKTFEQSKEGIHQISSIVLAMKEFAHPGTRAMAPADLNKILQSVMTVSRNEWKYVATIATDFQDRLRDVPCLADEISHVLLNIIVNAAQAIAEQQQGNANAPKGQITITTRAEGDSAVIIIADNGPGISAEILDKIFDPFFTTKSVGKGTGQGLAIAYDTVVNKHGGTINCTSAEGLGAEFRITLPFETFQANGSETPSP